MGGRNVNWSVRSVCEAGRRKAAVCKWRAKPAGFVEKDICVQFLVIAVGSGRKVDGSLFCVSVRSYRQVFVRLVQHCCVL